MKTGAGGKLEKSKISRGEGWRSPQRTLSGEGVTTFCLEVICSGYVSRYILTMMIKNKSEVLQTSLT